jgi:hypothetical protein
MRQNWLIWMGNLNRQRHFPWGVIIMKNWHLLVALTGSLMVMAAPCAAQKRPPPPKPSISSQQAKPSGRSARTGAARGQVSSGKAVAQRGKQSLRAQKDNLIRLIGRAEGLKPQRFLLRQQTIDAQRAYRANPSSANRAAWRAAVRAYLPVRQAHETARGQRDSAILRYKLSKSQRQAAMKSAAQSAATPPRLPPQPGRPAIRRQAAVRNLSTLRPTAAASREGIYANVGLIERPQGAGAGNYFTSATLFKAGLGEGSNYSPLPGAPLAGTGSLSGTAGSLSAGGTAGSFGSGSSSGTLPTIRLTPMETLPVLNLVQNGAGGN